MNEADAARTQAVNLITTQNVEIWSRGQVDLIPQIYRDDFVGYFPGGVLRGHDGIRKLVLSHRIAFPDWTETIEDVIVEGDRVAIRFTSTGTNLGPNAGKPPTNRRVEISELAIYRLADGKIAEQWVQPDTLSLQHQLYGDGQ